MKTVTIWPLAVLTLLGCCSLILGGCVHRQSSQSQITLPNPSALGQRAFSELGVLTFQRSSPGILPLEVRVLVKEGLVDEIQAFYDERVEIDQIATAIGSNGKYREVTRVSGPRFRMWQSSSHNLVIQLREFSGEKIVLEDDYGPVLHAGEKLLIFTRLNSRLTTRKSNSEN